MRVFLGVMSFFWLALGVVGLVGDNDPIFIVGLVNSAVTSSAGTVIDIIKKKENI